MKKILKTEEEMLSFAFEFAKFVEPGSIIFLDGQLGAGKTTFTRGFLRGLGYQQKVKSPTYTLVEPYEVSGKKIFHFDLYRLENAAELEEIGIRDYFTQDAICVIEWPEKGWPLLPSPDLVCHFVMSGAGREVEIEAISDRGEEMIKKIDK